MECTSSPSFLSKSCCLIIDEERGSRGEEGASDSRGETREGDEEEEGRSWCWTEMRGACIAQQLLLQQQQQLTSLTIEN